MFPKISRETSSILYRSEEQCIFKIINFHLAKFPFQKVTQCWKSSDAQLLITKYAVVPPHPLKRPASKAPTFPLILYCGDFLHFVSPETDQIIAMVCTKEYVDLEAQAAGAFC
jgi:hypothetical protein